MPTYLTPGVYVEEVPSANKPIEGVSTSVAAFVGLTPGGPVNTPMRISNWTQFSKIFGDPEQPGQRAVHGGRVHGPLRVRVLPERRHELLDRARRREQRRRLAAAGRAARRGRHVASRRSAPRRCRRSTAPVEVELTEEPKAGDGDQTYKLVVTSGSEREEYEGLNLKKGRTNLATKVNASSKLIKIEDTGASLPEAQKVPATGKYTLSAPAPEPSDIKPTHFEGDEAQAPRHGRPRRHRRGHDGPHARPLGRRQRHAGARPPGQDDRPLREHGRPDGDPRLAARPAPAGDPRVADEHRRLRLEDVGALLPVDRSRWIR